MWKQFLDLVPHLMRLLPHVDRYIQQRNAGDDTQKKNLEQFAQMTEGLRADLAKTTASHASLYRQLNDQSEQIAALSHELHAAKLTMNSSAAKLSALDRRLRSLRLSLVIALLVIVLLFCFAIGFTLRH